ncbi:MAG: hypothetical protein IJ019_01355 [Alphaproteobacteria bacterium]|nr:hypothetical protein [Alphaproteobacteria bacterium]
MGTLLKYLFYIFLIVVIYLLGVGFYEGTFNSDSTVGDVASDVTESTKNTVKDGYQATKDAIEDGIDAIK